MIHRLVATGTFILTAACATTPRAHDPGSNLSPPLSMAPKGGSEHINQWINEVDTGFTQTAQLSTQPVFQEQDLQPQAKSEPRHGIPLEMNARVDQWIRYFTERDRERFQRFLDRGHTYRPLIEKTLRQEGIPTELFYLALIESGFQNRARSHAGAVGIWQFIPATGRRYGLAVDTEIDERRDPIRATIAAARYLRDLNNVFQSWYLAMAAYNAGEMRILGAIMRSTSRDFWELAERKALPKETMNYIPKFLAAAIIGHHPERFGFRNPSADAFPELQAFAVPKRVPLVDLARTADIPLAKLQEWNPALYRNRTPQGQGKYEIWVTASAARSLERVENRLASLQQRSAPEPKVASSKSHVVRRGENLTLIAKRYGTTTAEITRINNLKTQRVFAGQTLRLQASQRAATTPPVQHYKVRRGDTLTGIAKRYQLSVSAIKELNHLRHGRVFAGQTLKLPRRG
jgi:membrane-bound lytic murein transglycosylase D